ncbi:uncharacterized protein BCR38DRAFT_446720 [Pseudomassariella vexata]|uniref:Uncharacterized protein n=1 Tax=Pseudomassariella vexata TaxID=1141098 RepID=A0A1Y2DHW1_9PEZI|nr:uncharacterized protein BCR38DRAFT_446720 [Pseudomassariella vexata]ORY58829.1 hypothetical protein BCR38DRAFT_446720 [Pseudomassariella vexata]
MSPIKMNHIQSFHLPRTSQTLSPLFTKLPGELRDSIYTYVLASYPDPSRSYDKNTPYYRPDYLSPGIRDCALLQTCQSIYAESWFRPWVSSTHTFWLAWSVRRPSHVLTVREFQPVLHEIYEKHGDVFLTHVRVFAQLCEMRGLPSILEMEHFLPRTMTMTIRHHDWWHWETDQRLYLDADVCTRHYLPGRGADGYGGRGQLVYPDSLAEIRLELESLVRKKEQIDYVANEMAAKWWFRLRDGTVMMAHAKDFEVDGWKGSSTWENDRWIRDETEPETLEYYIKTVVFKPNHALCAADDLEEPRKIQVPGRFMQIANDEFKTLGVRQLRRAGVPPGTPATEARRLVQEWQNSRGRFSGGLSYTVNTYANDNDDDDDDDEEGD